VYSFRIPLICVVALTWSTTLTTVGFAQLLQFTSYQDIEAAFANQQVELDRLQGRLAYLENYSDGGAVAAPQDCGDRCCSNCKSWIASAELVFLTPHHNEDDAAIRTSNDVGYRLMGGWDNGCGSGARVRWFDFEGDDGPDGTTDTLDVLGLETLDVEWYTSCDIGCGTTAVVSAGVRYLDYLEVFGTGSTLTLNGWGPVIGAELNRNVCGAFSLFALTRFSIVSVDGNSFGSNVDNQIASVTEIQVGGQLDYETCSGTYFLRGALEGHVLGDFGEGNGYGAGFFGGNVGAGVMW